MIIDKKLSYTLTELVKDMVLLKYHVTLTNKDKTGKETSGMFHSIYEFNRGRYITVRAYAYITLELKNREQAWDRSQSIMITTDNIFQLITHVNKIIANIYRPDCFYLTTDGETKLNVDRLDEYTVNAHNLLMDQRVKIQPSLVYNYGEDIFYEGATFFINNSNNAFSLPIDKLETFAYILKKVDFVLYTMAMVNYYFDRVYNEEEQNVEPVKVIRKPHVFTIDNKTDNLKEKEDEAISSSSIIKEESKDDIFDI